MSGKQADESMNELMVMVNDLIKGSGGKPLDKRDLKDFNYHRNRSAILDMGCCPKGFITLFICPKCQIIVRDGSVFCPNCHETKFIKHCGSKYCVANSGDEGSKSNEGSQEKGTADVSTCHHETRIIDRDYDHFYYKPSMAVATEVYMNMEDHLVDVTRQDIVGSVRNDKEQDCHSSVSSLNNLSISVRLDEKAIEKEIIQANPDPSPEDERENINPNYANSLEKKIRDQCKRNSIGTHL